MPKSSAVLSPNLGLYLDRPLLSIPPRALAACRNVRIKDTRVSRQNMGWDKFMARQLNGGLTGIDNFFLRDGGQRLVLLTTRDAYRYDEVSGDVTFLTPVEVTGTVDVSAADPAIVASASGPTVFDTNGAKAGDQISFGASDETGPDATWYTIASVDSDIQITLTGAVAGAPLTGTAYTIRKLFTGDIFDWWSAETFPDAQAVVGTDGDRWYATNGVDKIIAWDGVADHAYEPPYDFRCRVLARYKNMMIFGNITLNTGVQNPYSIKNSAIGEPENTATDEAGEFVVGDGVDPIVTIQPLGDNIVIYGNRSIVLGQFVGTPLLFVFRTAIAGLGPAAGRAVADFGDFHEFIGPDSQYRFDGITIEEIGGHVWREVLRQQAPQRFELFLAHFDEENGEILWGVPLTSDADPEAGPNETAYTEHYLENVGTNDPTPFAERDWIATATGYFDRQDTLTFDEIATAWEDNTFRWNDRFFQAAFPFNLFGDADGYVYTLGTSDSQDGTAIISYARFGRRAAADGRSKGVIKRIYPFVARHNVVGATLTVRLWGADQASGPLTNLGDFSFDLQQSADDIFFVSVRKAARFVQIEFRNEVSGVPWFLDGYDLDAVLAGAR